MSVLDLIYQRSSCHVHEMQHPAPNGAQLKRILQAVMSAPDHGHIKPWHMVVIDSDHVMSLCELMCNVWLEHAKHIEPGRVHRLTSYLKNAPMVVLVSANIIEPHAVSRRDQVLSAASACQNILLAAEQEGVGAIWYSTDAVGIPQVHQLFGLTEQQEPVAFIMLGTKKSTQVKKRSDVASHCYQWIGNNQLTPLFDSATLKVADVKQVTDKKEMNDAL